MFRKTKKKKKKPARPKAPACATAATDTPPTLDSSTPKTLPRKKNSPAGGDLHRGTPGAYEKLAAFANRNISASGANELLSRLAMTIFEEPRAAGSQLVAKTSGYAVVRIHALLTARANEPGKNARLRRFRANPEGASGAAFKNRFLKYAPAASASGRPQDALDALLYPAPAPNPIIGAARSQQ